jgi:hypothetical protein
LRQYFCGLCSSITANSARPRLTLGRMLFHTHNFQHHRISHNNSEFRHYRITINHFCTSFIIPPCSDLDPTIKPVTS